MYDIEALVFTLNSDPVTKLQFVMYKERAESQTQSHLVDLVVESGSKPTGHVHSSNLTMSLVVENIEFLHGPSAERFIVSESCGE